MSENALEAFARNKNVARGQLRRLSLGQLEKVNDIIDEVLDEKRQEDNLRMQEEEAKAQKLAEIQAALSESGLSVEDLLNAEEGKRRRGRPRKE